MLAYYFTLGVRSLRRNPVLTALMVLTLAVGVAASMSSLTLLYVMSGDPIPQKSDRLFVPQLDNAPLQQPNPSDEPPAQLTYRDAMAFKASAPSVRETALIGISGALDSGRTDQAPTPEQGVAVHADFFEMFDVPFRSGGAWSESDDARGGNVAVISASLADRVFGEADAVGKSLRFEGRDYTVTGVIEKWEPLPKFYRLIGGNVFDFEDVFLPFNNAMANQMSSQGSVDCNVDGEVEPGYQGLMRSECTWIQYWVELADAGDREQFAAYLDDYVTEQKKLGRFQRPLNNRLYDVMGWLEEREIVGDDSRLQTWLAFGFLLVCLVNVIGLLLAKFTARSGEIGVRRALGAPRREVFKQYLIEAGVVGIVGGVLGIALTFGVLELMSRQSEAIGTMARVDWVMLATAFGLSLAASLLAGLLPTWRACQVRPAVQLKSQ
ncbi:ABC transporter permease [Cognatilysobacter bugurensis]|uniref:ABC transporter ATP-binding protein n=1 Tax=Cognatilysobacter bugurensis TaxID=543356 RepID=A0A918SYV3_9GAMM|nr:ABC transporter permease [Lysobacter bugurensis]GHA79981.1 ABC transporter ATP-binding protein [Lysobacter bugurensis]